MSATRGPAHHPRALRALAHPLRWKLIDLLGSEQTVTATRSAAVLGESVATCSYHLNILRKYGFVEEAAGGRGREKPWRLTSFEQNLSGEGLGVEGQRAAEAAGEVFLDHELARLKDQLRRHRTEPDEWRSGIGFGGVTTMLTADELREVSRALHAIAGRYAGRAADRDAAPPGAREVRIFISTSVSRPTGAARGMPETGPASAARGSPRTQLPKEDA